MAQDTTNKQSNFLARAIAASKAFTDAYNNLRQLRAEYAAENYSTITQAIMDGSGLNPPQTSPATKHLTPTILTNLMSTFDFIDSAINSSTGNLQGSVGYLTNLYNMLG